MAAHYFTADDPSDEWRESLGLTRPIRVSSRNQTLFVKTSPNVFSAGHLDTGTEQLLLKAPPLPDGGNFLDLGSGWGPLALTMAKEAPTATVWAVDVNPLALELTRLNAEANQITNVKVMTEEDAEKFVEDQEVQFDVIWSNPPIRIGKAALRKLLVRWLRFLADDGVAFLVVSRHLGADSLARWLDTQGFRTSREASRKGFRILSVRR